MDELEQATAGLSADLTGTATGNQQPTQVGTPTDTEQTAPAPRTYTQDEVQRMSTSQYAAGLAAAMKEAGFEPTRGEDFKRQMTAFRAWQGSQKTEAEKQAEALQQAAADLATEQAKTQALERRMAALAKGVPAERIDRYVAVAATYVAQDVTFDAALEQALADFPLPVERGLPRIAAGQTQSSQPPARGWAHMTLTERAALYRKSPEDARAAAKQAGEALAE